MRAREFIPEITKLTTPGETPFDDSVIFEKSVKVADFNGNIVNPDELYSEWENSSHSDGPTGLVLSV